MKPARHTCPSARLKRATPPIHSLFFIIMVASIHCLTALADAEISMLPTRDFSTSESTLRINRSLGRGINIGNALDAPTEGAWGVVIEDNWFDLIADAGFDSVRLPIRWSAHASQRPPYTIDEQLFQRVDHIIKQAKRVRLPIILNVHHYEELMQDPAVHGPRFVALWQQIAARYAQQPQSVLFELLNEPSEEFTRDPQLWNKLIDTTLKRIRKTNPQRPVMVGPVGYNGINWLKYLKLPADPNLIVSVHFYAPMNFTHQGATWSKPFNPVGVRWDTEQKTLANNIEQRSWNTTLESTQSNLTINFEKQHSGFSLVFPASRTPKTLRLRTRGKVDLSLGCAVISPLQWISRLTHESDEWIEHTISLDACPNESRRIGLMNQHPNASMLELSTLEICNDDECRALIVPAAHVVQSKLLSAKAWGKAHGRPMHIGEFGVFNLADPLSRANWTTEVQRIATDAGMATAYWALGTKFGIYDSENETWNNTLLDALLP